MSFLIPKQARSRPGTKTKAWWYDERGAISIYVTDDKKMLSCTIKRSDLVKYINRTAKRKAA